MKPHRIGVLALDGVVPGDLAIPCDVFSRVPGPAYEVRVCGDGVVSAGHFEIVPPWPLDALAACHTVVVPGVADLGRPHPPAVLDALRRFAACGGRVVSICTGAFVLAAAGLLDGRRATTHWAAAEALARRHPEVEVDPDVLYVDDGAVLTSAGAAAGLDLCLYLVWRDLGAEVAATAARYAVMPLEREGGQAQFIEHPAPEHPGSLRPLLTWIEANPAAELSNEALARRFAASPRTLARAFQRQLGTTPAAWVRRARVRHAQALLETTDLSMEEVAARSGFASPATLRAVFHQELDTAPTRYRASFSAR
ncbi:MAG: helix-turn-helix domain-containing protein [Alphaproteobacteria bacterium]|nr:helix-turn-helix domain-containing protein [Alphaproteobacteria bacterium]